MGIIDSTTFKLSCSCRSAELQTVVQYGSNYGAGEWQSGKSFDAFDVRWGPGHSVSGPQIASAACKACGSPAAIEIS
ncbi:hypothetical protein J2X02_000911 [Pseudoxanthomonas japonensis]|uniref:hypothetical protein n=1 Tax=Pseudoxanthomonas japonensis TaxID=69284 RepID=UPI002859FE3C|nr:hypothetical protein [Pseudoxanthomonas japonensis]MDR7068094.1 hypothetical protein [Pseudoxanthomonas japonensis]